MDIAPHVLPSDPAVAGEREIAPSASRPMAVVPYTEHKSSRLGLMWWGGAIGAIALWTAVIVAGVLIWDLTSAGEDVAATLVAIAITVAAGVVFGMGTLWYAARTFAKINFAVLALVLVTGGLSYMVAAPVVRQMNTRDLAEYTGFSALLIFGAISTWLGVALGLLCIRWSMSRRARRLLSSWSRLLGSAYGVMLALTGIGVLQLFLSLINGEATHDELGIEHSVVERAITFAVIAAMTLLPGIILTFQGISASMGSGSGAFRPPVAAWGFLAFAIVLGIGQANMAMDSPIAAPMPVLHTLAAILPGLTLAAMAGRGSWRGGIPVRGLTWRQVTLAAAISMSVGVAVALYVEVIGSLYAVTLLLVHSGGFETARDLGVAWDRIGEADFRLSNNEQFIAGLFTASVLAPLSEEFGKSLGVRFMMRANSTRAQCFLLGAFAGAGFAFLEALLYGLGGISEGSLSSWWAIMLIRGGSTSLHVLCTGLAGLGWWYWSRAKEHRTALALFGGAMLIHAAWNAFATIISSRIFYLDTLDSTLLAVVAYVIIVVVSLSMTAAIPLTAKRLREHIPPPDGTPLGSMAPWLG
jgi:hypothetical protein